MPELVRQTAGVECFVGAADRIQVTVRPYPHGIREVNNRGGAPISVYLRIASTARASVCCWHMKQSATVLEELDDWELLCSFLPEGWEDKARECGALTRARGIGGADALLRVLLIHIANGCSLAETSVRAEQMGLSVAAKKGTILAAMAVTGPQPS